MLLFYEGVYVRCSEGTLKLVVKRSLSTCQPRSQCFSLPIYFLQSFWVQYFASNHMSSQAIYPRLNKKNKKKRIKIAVFLKFFVSVRAVKINNPRALLLGLPKSIYDHILVFSDVLFNDCDKYLLTEHSTMQGQRVNRTQPFPYLIS